MTPPTGTDAAALAQFVRALERCRPSDLADLVVDEAERTWGASGVGLWLVTHEQTELVPLSADRSPRRVPQPVADGPAGRCFTTITQVVEKHRLWTPVLYAGDRLGVLELTLPDPATTTGRTALDVAAFAAAVGLALGTSQGFCDHVETVRRSQEMSLGAELLWSVLPPPAFACAEVELAVMLEPTYSTGGDAYDYAVNGDTVHLLVLDAMGHGFPAASLSTVAVAAYRHSRRAGLGLPATLRAMDTLVGGQFESSFATAVLAELDLTTGGLRWVSAGHPPPLVVRRSRTVEVLEADPAPPLGVGAGLGAATEQVDYLEPGDVLALYTDGVTEGRHLDGSMVGDDAFAELLLAQTEVFRPVVETMRRVRQSLLAAEDDWHSDDVTAMLVRWQPAPVVSADVR